MTKYYRSKEVGKYYKVECCDFGSSWTKNYKKNKPTRPEMAQPKNTAIKQTNCGISREVYKNGFKMMVFLLITLNGQ